jgi:predicted metal-dependent peptidase
MNMFAPKITEPQRLDKAVIDIMNHDRYIALCGVIMVGERLVKDGIPTACTNGRDEYYGREFIAGLTDAELRFVILHECAHKMYRHLITWRHLWDIDARLCNHACDYVINLRIVDDNKADGFATMPTGDNKGLLDERFRDMSTAQVFNILRQEEEEKGDDEGDEPQGFDDHDWEGAQELTEAEKGALEREISEAIHAGALTAGKAGSGGNRDIDALMEPQVNWREVLREFINTTCSGNDYSTWKRPNRRFIGAGVYLPSGISEAVGELAVHIDTSGSIGGVQLSAFLSEVKAICDTVHPAKLHLTYWDTQVCKHEVYLPEDMETLINSTKPEGGGGTDVRGVPVYLAEHGITPQANIVLTDGLIYGGWGQWKENVLWCVLDNKSAVPDVGKIVHIKTGDM